MKKVIGFDIEFNKLLEQLKNGNLNNSIIISGNKGIGKNYLIKNLIEEYLILKINNEQIKNHITLLYNNSHPNIKLITKEIDEKTKKIKNFITVEQIRELQQFSFETSSIETIPKFILIDSADDLNLNASNALLKLLEEPTINTYLFLTSHNPSSLLSTIKSRCLKINLSNHNYENFTNILKLTKPNIDEELIKFFFDITNGSPGLTIAYDFDEILKFFENIIYQITDIDPFSKSNNELVDYFSKFENEKLKIYLSLIKFILIMITKIKIGLDISTNYLSKNILKLEQVSDQISLDTIQRKLDYLIINENDLFTFNLDKRIFMINFIAEK